MKAIVWLHWDPIPFHVWVGHYEPRQPARNRNEEIDHWLHPLVLKYICLLISQEPVGSIPTVYIVNHPRNKARHFHSMWYFGLLLLKNRAIAKTPPCHSNKEVCVKVKGLKGEIYNIDLGRVAGEFQQSSKGNLQTKWNLGTEFGGNDVL